MFQFYYLETLYLSNFMIIKKYSSYFTISITAFFEFFLCIIILTVCIIIKSKIKLYYFI